MLLILEYSGGEMRFALLVEKTLAVQGDWDNFF